MAKPKFSIVIPTRERAYTLKYALRTCVEQKYEDFEIVVCDNCSSPATKQVVDSFGSGKIKYVRSDTPLAMSDNWELALSHADGEYVIIIGDDDGMLPQALTDLDLFIDKTHAKAIRWTVASYVWPDAQGGLAVNKIHIPAAQESIRIDSHRAIKSVIEGENDFSFLPMLYYSAIHRDLIAELKARTGKVFKSGAPDVYSGFAIGYLARTHYLLGKPITIVGYSGKSNGTAALMVKGENSIEQEFHALNASAGYFLDKQVPNIPAMTTYVANEFIRAKQTLFPNEDQFSLDRKQLIVNYVNDLENFNRVGKDEWGAFMHAIENTLGDDRELLGWFQHTYLENYEPQGKAWIFSQEGWRDGLTTDSLFLDAGKFDVSDVFGAAQLCEKFLTRTTSFVEVVDQSASSNISELHQDLKDKEQVINSFRTMPRFWLMNGPLAEIRLFQIAAGIARRLKALLFSR